MVLPCSKRCRLSLLIVDFSGENVSLWNPRLCRPTASARAKWVRRGFGGVSDLQGGCPVVQHSVLHEAVPSQAAYPTGPHAEPAGRVGNVVPPSKRDRPRATAAPHATAASPDTLLGGRRLRSQASLPAGGKASIVAGLRPPCSLDSARIGDKMKRRGSLEFDDVL